MRNVVRKTYKKFQLSISSANWNQPTQLKKKQSFFQKQQKIPQKNLKFINPIISVHEECCWEDLRKITASYVEQWSRKSELTDMAEEKLAFSEKMQKVTLKIKNIIKNVNKIYCKEGSYKISESYVEQFSRKSELPEMTKKKLFFR